MAMNSAIFAICAITGFAFAARTQMSKLPRSQSGINKATYVRVTFDGSGKVIIESNSVGAAWFWDPATRTASMIADFIARRPVGGTEIVITEKSSCATRIAIPVDATGTVTLPSDLEDGSYNLRVHIPQKTYMANVPLDAPFRFAALTGDLDVKFTLSSSSGKIKNMAISEKPARGFEKASGFNLIKGQRETDKRC